MVELDDLDVLTAIKSCIQDNLTDPLTQWGQPSRIWVHLDEPLLSVKFPRIQVVKRGPTNNEILNIGWSYMESREVIIDIYLFMKHGFKWSNDSGVTYLKNEQLMMKYLGKIWTDALKLKLESLSLNSGISGIKNIGEDMPVLMPDTQLYKGVLSISARYFYGAC